MGDAPLLELRNLNKVYEDGYHAVRDVSYSLGPGLLVGLIGPNGCGKTTMMRCINRLHDCTSGDVLIDGESVLSKTPGEIARKVANVPAELRTSFGLTVYETVMLGRYPHMRNLWWEPMEDEEFVSETLRKFGVYHLRDRPLNMLSSGERQRVLIAKAYVQEPRLMLVDEPTSHLDMKYKLDVMEYLNAMVPVHHHEEGADRRHGRPEEGHHPGADRGRLRGVRLRGLRRERGAVRHPEAVPRAPRQRRILSQRMMDGCWMVYPKNKYGSCHARGIAEL